MMKAAPLFLCLPLVLLALLGCNGPARTTSDSVPPLVWEGEAPVTIALHAMTGEDFVQPVILASPSSIDGRIFLRETLRADADLTTRGEVHTANGSADDVAASAALLDRAASDDGDGCEPTPGLPAWPRTWRVRFYGADGRVMRDFTVPARVVRCRARDYVGKRPFLAALAELGAPPGNAPAHVAPEVAQATLLALVRGTEDASALTISLADGRGVRIRFATQRSRSRNPVVVQDATLRAMLDTALSHSTVVAGMQRSARTYSHRIAHGEFRVFRRYEDKQPEVLVFSAYMPKDDADSLVQSMAAAVSAHDAAAARKLRAVRFLPG